MPMKWPFAEVLDELGCPWKAPDGTQTWWYHPNNGLIHGIYLFAPEYTSVVLLPSEYGYSKWMLLLPRDGWERGVCADRPEDLWPVFMTWKLTGILEAP